MSLARRSGDPRLAARRRAKLIAAAHRFERACADLTHAVDAVVGAEHLRREPVVVPAEDEGNVEV